MNFLPTLLAAPGDWISVLIPIVVAIIWVLNQVFGKLAQPQNPQRDIRRPVPPPRPQPQPVRPQQAKVDEEIESFLRRAAQQRGGQAQRPAPPPQPEAPTRTLVPPSERTRAPLRRPDLVQVEVVEEEGVSSRGPLTERHLDTSVFAERAAQMTMVDQANEQMAQRLHDVFDRPVGGFGYVAAAAEDRAATAASVAATASKVTAGNVAALLRDPNSLRNAVIMQEILRPPLDRW